MSLLWTRRKYWMEGKSFTARGTFLIVSDAGRYVHRDVACRNCLVNSSRTIKLSDFGMARPMFER